MTIRIKKGLDLPIAGLAGSTVQESPTIQHVALISQDYPGVRPNLQVQEGDKVKKGQVLFLDKKNPGVQYTAFTSGTITAIHRGTKRMLQSIVIKIDGEEQLTFKEYPIDQLARLSPQTVREHLVASGLWTALRTRPFSQTPAIDSVPAALFVTAMDTQPLAPDPVPIIRQHADAFLQGLTVLTRLTEGKIYLCSTPNAALPQHPSAQIVLSEFSGPHPAGLVGTHIHFLQPVSLQKQVWHLSYQDVIAFGKLFTTGQLFTERVVTLAGPQVKQPRLLRTTLGACLTDLTVNQLHAGENRIISGSVLSGTLAAEPHAFLGRFHHQVSVLLEGREQQLLGWIRPGGDKFSITRTTVSAFQPRKRLALTTAKQGGDRAMVPIGTYERVMPLDILPTLLLRALIVGDSETAQALGALELDEEDLALCTVVCPGKYEYGPLLRAVLTQIEKEG